MKKVFILYIPPTLLDVNAVSILKNDKGIYSLYTYVDFKKSIRPIKSSAIKKTEVFILYIPLKIP